MLRSTKNGDCSNQRNNMEGPSRATERTLNVFALPMLRYDSVSECSQTGCRIFSSSDQLVKSKLKVDHRRQARGHSLQVMPFTESPWKGTSLLRKLTRCSRGRNGRLSFWSGCFFLRFRPQLRATGKDRDFPESPQVRYIFTTLSDGPLCRLISI